jgi:hypothetical protein
MALRAASAYAFTMAGISDASRARGVGYLQQQQQQAYARQQLVRKLRQQQQQQRCGATDGHEATAATTAGPHSLEKPPPPPWCAANIPQSGQLSHNICVKQPLQRQAPAHLQSPLQDAQAPAAGVSDPLQMANKTGYSFCHSCNAATAYTHLNGPSFGVYTSKLCGTQLLPH